MEVENPPLGGGVSTEEHPPGAHVVKEWKELLNCLLEDALDKFEVMNLARRFSIQLPDEKSFS